MPTDVVARRFTSGLRNFTQLYAPLVDAWSLYDNSVPEPQLADWKDTT